MAAETEVGTAPLTQAELEHFATEGYLLLPSICDAELSALVRADIDAVMDVYDTTQGTSARASTSAPPGPNRRAVVIAEQPHLPYCATVADFQQLQPVVSGGAGQHMCEQMVTVTLDTVYRASDEANVTRAAAGFPFFCLCGAGRCRVDLKGLLH